VAAAETIRGRYASRPASPRARSVMPTISQIYIISTPSHQTTPRKRRCVLSSGYRSKKFGAIILFHVKRDLCAGPAPC
jgi:hypothetical protein